MINYKTWAKRDRYTELYACIFDERIVTTEERTVISAQGQPERNQVVKTTHCRHTLTSQTLLLSTTAEKRVAHVDPYFINTYTHSWLYSVFRQLPFAKMHANIQMQIKK